MTEPLNPQPEPEPATSNSPDPAGDPQPRSIAARWWFVPALTFLVGLLLGGVLIAALRPSSGTNPSSDTATTSSSTPASQPATGSTAAATATVVVPAECLQVSQDAQELVDLTRQAASAARDLDAGRLSDLVRQIDQAQTTLRSHAQSCRAVDTSLSSGTTPSITTSPGNNPGTSSATSATAPTEPSTTTSS